MRFVRLFLVVLLVTLCGGVFGAAVGGLMGFATPNALEVVFDVELEQASADQDVARIENSSGDATSVSVAATGERSLALYGASLGGSFGLIAGAVFGLGLGALDQIILALTAFARNRKAASHPT